MKYNYRVISYRNGYWSGEQGFQSKKEALAGLKSSKKWAANNKLELVRVTANTSVYSSRYKKEVIKTWTRKASHPHWTDRKMAVLTAAMTNLEHPDWNRRQTLVNRIAGYHVGGELTAAQFKRFQNDVQKEMKSIMDSQEAMGTANISK